MSILMKLKREVKNYPMISGEKKLKKLKDDELRYIKSRRGS